MNQGRIGSRRGSSGGGGGTRFRLFCQAPLLAAFRRPVTVELSPSPGSIDIGPTDRRIAVIRPLDKRRSYGQLLLAGAVSGSLLPPWRGPVAEPARPGPGGH